MRSSEVKNICGGKLCCVSKDCVIKDHFPTHFLSTPQRMAAANIGKKKKKVRGGGGKRIIFKKEHNLTFHSTTHSTPPPHSLVSPPACFHFTLPQPLCHRSANCTSQTHFLLCVPNQLGTHWKVQLCKDLGLLLSSERR